MPKPASPLPIWASNVTYLTGGKIGSPTKVAIPLGVANDGHRPGSAFPTGGQHWNDWLNQLSSWVEFVDEASSAGAEDQHLVETDGSGETSIAKLNVLGAAALVDSLVVGAPGGGGSSVDVTPPATGFGVIVSGTTTVASTRSQNLGSGLAIEGQNLGTGNGGRFTSSAAATRAVDVSAGTDAFGVYIDGNGGTVTVGLFIDVDDGAPCIIQKTNAGLHPTLFLDGHPAPARANLALSDQADPSIATAGDLWMDHGLNNFGRGFLKFRVEDGVDGGGAIGINTVWSTVNGHAFKFSSSLGDTTESAGTFATKVTVVIDTGETTPGKPPGVYLCQWSAEVRLAGGAATTDNGEVRIRLNGVTLAQEDLHWDALGQDQLFGGTVPVVLGASTVFTFTIEWRTLNSPNGVIISDAYLSLLGAFNQLD